jgi:hypothetical protein
MCFDCSAFQYQLDKTKPYKDHIFQTIFLNNKDEHTWQKDEIKKECISELPRRSSADNSSRGLVASAVSRLDTLRLCRTFHLGFEPKLQAHYLRCRLDSRQRSRSRCYLWKGRCLQARSRLPYRVVRERLRQVVYEPLPLAGTRQVAQQEANQRLLNTGISPSTCVNGSSDIQLAAFMQV